jgi:hypothetical protein
MPFITFIYKIGKHTYYGKYISDYVSDDHEGLDIEIKDYLVSGINKYRVINNKPVIKEEIFIGILSFSSHQYIPVFSSENEKKCFDFYAENFKYNCKIYVNGNLIE